LTAPLRRLGAMSVTFRQLSLPHTLFMVLMALFIKAL
jgi:hypothetical protein